MINIIIADDHPIFRQGIVSIVEKSTNIKILAQAKDGQEAIEQIKEFKPDIAVLDIDMPQVTGLDVIRKLKRINCNCKFIILTMLKDIELFNEVKQLGGQGYLLKDSASDELVECIKRVNNNETYIDQLLLKQIESKNQTNDVLENLTKTEKNVLKLVARELTTKEIADMLFVSPKTVENHRSNICKKLNISGVNALQKFIAKHQINHF
jgi:DNA-binding NarL/FixJ family response regulator